MKRHAIALALVIFLVLAAGCSSGISTMAGGANTTASQAASASTTAAITTKIPTTSLSTGSTTAVKPGTATATTATAAATTAAPPLKQGGEAFKKQLASSTPVFTDQFENKAHVPETIDSTFYKQSVPSTRHVTATAGQAGNGIHLDSYDSYVGYAAGIIKGSEGTIRFSYKPDANIYLSYNERQSAWKDYGSIAPPYTGFLIDTVGWNSAFKGGFSATLTFRKGDPVFSHLSFGSWSGSNWSYTQAELTPTIRWDSSKWYDIVLSYSKSKGRNAVYIDGYLAGEAKFNTDLSLSEGFFIGQSPWKASFEYWPYGPHALMGTYDNLRIYDQAIMD